MKRAIVTAALIALPGCAASLGEQRKEACTARAKAATLPRGFELDVAQDSGDLKSGGMATVYFFTGDTRGNSVRKMAVCFHAPKSAAMDTFVITDA